MSDLFPDTLSVSELNALAKNLLEQGLAGVWVAGEVSNLVRAASGHYYFSLKDNRAQVRCALFKGSAARLGAPLKEGDHIEVSGQIGIYEARGEFQITVSQVRLKGLGRLYEAYEQLKAQLQAEGLFAAERKQPLPERPRTIGIVTSLAAAALRDVVSTLRRRAPEIPLIVYPTAVQGKGSAEEIARAVHTAGRRAECDVLIVCRGGGSIEDLWSFNEESVVRAIAACPLPVVCGVGHETDFTLSDFAADVRAPTPTAAAELAAPDRSAVLRHLNQLQRQLHASALQRYHDAGQRLDWLARHIRHPQHKLAEQRRQTEALGQQLTYRMQQQLRLLHSRLNEGRLNWRHSRPQIQILQQRTDELARIWQPLAARLTAQRRDALARQQDLLEAVSPQHILARGFSVVKNSRGQVVRDAAQLKQGQKLHIVFAEGEADVRVTAEQAQPDLFDFS